MKARIHNCQHHAEIVDAIMPIMQMQSHITQRDPHWTSTNVLEFKIEEQIEIERID